MEIKTVPCNWTRKIHTLATTQIDWIESYFHNNWRSNVNFDGCRVLVRIELRHLCLRILYVVWCRFVFILLDSMKLWNNFGDSVRDTKFNRMQISNGLNAQTDRHTAYATIGNWKLAIVMSRQSMTKHQLWRRHKNNIQTLIYSWTEQPFAWKLWFSSKAVTKISSAWNFEPHAKEMWESDLCRLSERLRLNENRGWTHHHKFNTE